MCLKKNHYIIITGLINWFWNPQTKSFNTYLSSIHLMSKRKANKEIKVALKYQEKFYADQDISIKKF